MIKVLFICHGNICRSVMAEMILKDIISKKELKDKIMCDSMAVSSEEIGNGIYPNALRELNRRNVKTYPHKATRFKASDYENYDYILCMDYSNLYRLKLTKEDVNNKYSLLLKFTGTDDEISDPWYTRNFSLCFDDLKRGIDAFLKHVL